MAPGIDHTHERPAIIRAAPSEPAAPTSGLIAGGVRPLVLAVDDDPVQRALLHAVLQRAGFDVVLASDGDEATSLAVDLRPDVIVTDALMPQTSGLELISRLQSRLGNARVPTIVVSGTSDVATRLDAFEIGADDFLAKPYDPAELVARINAQLRVAGHWTAQSNAMLAELRSARRGIVDSRSIGDAPTAAETRLDAARRVFDDRPTALSCALLAVVDRRGNVDWAPRPAVADWQLVQPAIAGLGPATPTVDLEVGPRGRCPLCGAAGEGRLAVTAAGHWDQGSAYVLIGCQSPARQTHRLLVEELADQIGLLLDHAHHRGFADDHARDWIDSLIADQRYRFVFQPIMTLASRRVVGYEALARFDDGIDPLEVLDLASQAGRRVSLELALVRGALKAAGVFPEGTWIHVNVSPLAALAPEVAAMVAESHQRVVLEITEDALFDSDGATSLRTSLPASCRLAIDDVGAGYAGLSRLLEVRPDIVKIDRAIIEGIHLDPARQALVAGLVQFGNVTDSMVIAEGIEHEEERAVLHRLGVRFAQGYLFAHPESPLAVSIQFPAEPTID